MLSADIGFRYASNLFLRLLGVVYFIAFYSLWVQVHGLMGTQGIIPVADAFDASGMTFSPAVWFSAPTLLWWFQSDSILSLLAIIGMLASVLLALGFIPMLCSGLLWVLYLSFTVGGQVFFSQPWDHLLLEAGILAVFLSPAVIWSRPSMNPEPSRSIVFLLYWLLFRLIFSAGYAKLTGGDPAWFNLSALQYYFWTQPLPTWIAWYVHQMPPLFLKFMTAFVLFVELAVPFLIFTTRTLRTVAFGLLIFLQILIGITGNYGFLNLLTMVLCVLLLDDAWFEGETTQEATMPSQATQMTLALLRVPATVMIGLATIPAFSATLAPDFEWPSTVTAIARVVKPFRAANSYGLFEVMNRTRSEVIIEGSRDGRDWYRYEFLYKPGDEHRTPPMVAPHMPRLDWQMAFIGASHYRDNPWVMNFMQRLLENATDVTGLLETNPFGNEPPRYLRAVQYDYTFSSRKDFLNKDMWWRRELKGLYTPVVVQGL